MDCFGFFNALGGGFIGVSIGIDLLSIDPCDFDLLHAGQPQCSDGCSSALASCAEFDFIEQSELKNFGASQPLVVFKICGGVLVAMAVILCVLQLIQLYNQGERFLNVVSVGYLIVFLTMLACNITGLVYVIKGVDVKIKKSASYSSCTCTCKYKGDWLQICLFIVNTLLGTCRFAIHYKERQAQKKKTLV
eukprot:scpid88736/ scgid33013/ 